MFGFRDLKRPGKYIAFSIFNVATLFGLVANFHFLTAANADGQQANIAISSSSNWGDLLWADSVGSQIVSHAVGGSLVSVKTSNAGQKNLHFEMARSISALPNFSGWRVVLKDALLFQSGRPVSADDVLFSLNICREKGKLPLVKEIKKWQRVIPYDAPPYRAYEAGAELLMEERVTDIASIADQLSRCPIVEEESSRIFGSVLGTGLSMVCAGPFRLSELSPSGELILQRSAQAPENMKYFSSIALRPESDLRRGITALRLGTVDAYYVSNISLDDLKVATSGDETLVMDDCSDFRGKQLFLLRRRGFSLDCGKATDSNRFDMTELHYDFKAS